MNANELKQRDAEALALMVRVVTQVKVYLTFYGALLERLKLKVDRRHPTMYTDAVVIGFSPDFVLSQRFEELVYIVVHEVTHCALEHPFRRNGREPKMWNIACDHVVNLALNEDADLRAGDAQRGVARAHRAADAGAWRKAEVDPGQGARRRQQPARHPAVNGAGADAEPARQLSRRHRPAPSRAWQKSCGSRGD